MSFTERTAFAFASLGPLGRMPASGTVGSLAAMLAAPWLFLDASFAARLCILALVFLGGGLACDVVERVTCRKDPGLCIIDEVLGQWLAYLCFPALSVRQLVLGFVLFRIFDIAKPWPVRASESWLPGGFGVMLDDALAGVYAAMCLGVLVRLGV
ncbi:phosphatidylglycerophosphatase A family protein [Fundidesulfovibrio agrisoli]|uniref:phosphatidylglycerophosphatase A family protein n=1 Tax=Fundidesulfovibrio agrisoli TaxID=2922717 RepID=UPI001FAE17BD|nr:phosphatidylglycerophosphatase A [Fundidesulfovibrio agrisoli]